MRPARQAALCKLHRACSQTRNTLLNSWKLPYLTIQGTASSQNSTLSVRGAQVRALMYILESCQRLISFLTSSLAGQCTKSDEELLWKALGAQILLHSQRLMLA